MADDQAQDRPSAETPPPVNNPHDKYFFVAARTEV